MSAPPHQGTLLCAVIDEPGDFAAEVFAVDNEVEEAVLLEEFAALEAFGEFDLDGVPDRSRSREADEGLGFGDDEVAEHGEAGGDAARCRVGEEANEELLRLVEPCEGSAGL